MFFRSLVDKFSGLRFTPNGCDSGTFAAVDSNGELDCSSRDGLVVFDSSSRPESSSGTWGDLLEESSAIIKKKQYLLTFFPQYNDDDHLQRLKKSVFVFL